jgi:toxin YoeB
MEVEYFPQAKEDLDYWKKSGNKIVLNKIVELIKDILKTPYTGIGKPEPLKYKFSGLWSRRISEGHRLIYEVGADVVYIHSLRGHYS